MAVRKDTIFERFLAPIFQNFLIDRDALMRYYKSRDWEQVSNRFRQPNFTYPNYYQAHNFHGVEGGYLSLGAALSYDPITQYVLPPNEAWVRQELIDRIRCYPRRILDLGCGTGSMTLMLKQKFPQAEVIGLDFSPYMLAVADDKANAAEVAIAFLQGNAEATNFATESFDVVTAALLFHETPPEVSKNILREGLRLLKSGGEALIFDGNQSTLRQTEWLTEIFEEPYIKAYAKGNLDAWMGAAGFEDVRTEQVWWVHQITRGVKPLPARSPDHPNVAAENNPAFAF
ncbi:MAG: class I SAM-dependent methyltransferase [Drouetiella hepatica Uher 2000/2452]|jgi:ubiquinone/menaquinone biosynthesis C-methylase UbiE|uniref:Class I SAM-dependent methyltransferase n=1 Tax=Drouetiella hepatica Uher 2000/2452 TaxID=904376 RepID=A0A951UQ19_9CYAN|nr:class I SAM-dependent methyltransferase [Drouetiella hepatica Uher 2000/2452]